MSIHTFELVRSFELSRKGYGQFKELKEFIIADSKKHGYFFPHKDKHIKRIPKFKGQGIRVILYEYEFFIAIKFIITLQSVLVTNDLVNLISKKDAENALNIVNWKLTNWLGDNYSVDNITLSRVDICSNLYIGNAKEVAAYVAQMYRTGTIKSFRIMDGKDYGDKFNKKAGFTAASKHDGSELSIYDKKAQLESQKLSTDGAEGILRAEYRISAVREFCKRNGGKCRSNTDTLLWYIENSSELLTRVLERFCIDADYYKLKEIREMISDNVKSKKLRSRMCRFTELVAKRHGMRNARKKLEQEDNKFNSRAYKKMISEFERIGVNPVPLPDRGKLDTLPSLFEWIE